MVTYSYLNQVIGKTDMTFANRPLAPVTILVMFPVSNNSMALDYYFLQPQFGYNELEWSLIKMALP